MIRVSRVKLGKARKADEALERTLMRLRWLYNGCLEQRRDAWRKQRTSLSRYDQHKELTALRADDEHYRQLPVEMTRATVTARLDFAFKSFFRRLKAAQRRVSAGQRGSNRRRKHKAELGRVHEHIANRRRNFVHQTAAALVKARRLRNELAQCGNHTLGWRHVERTSRS